MPGTVLMARFYHESNTFVTSLTDRADFEQRYELRGEDIPARLRGTNSEVGGIIDVADEKGVSLIHTIVAEAEPGGPVTESAYEQYANEIVDQVKEQLHEFDGIILPLHGAMVATHLDDGEGALVSRIRSIVGEAMPIVVTIDPNANVSDEMVATADAIIAYETTPHIDTYETGEKGMRLLCSMLTDDVEPVMHVERPPVIPSAVRSTTLEPPLAGIAATARDMEAQSNVLKVNVCQGFWPADIHDMGFAIVSVTDGDEPLARKLSREIARDVWDRREEFVEETLEAEEAVREANELLSEDGDRSGPIVIAEMHDNPGGGKPADGTKLLSAMLSECMGNSGMAIMRDEDAVEACVRAGVGSRVTLNLGGKTEDPAVYGGPICELDGYVKAITDGKYENMGPMRTGEENDLGRTVRLQCGNDTSINVIVSEHRAQPLDAELWRHVGVQPERLDVIGLKSAVHYRADYGRIASEMISVDESPAYEYERLPRNMYPLDDVDEEYYPDW